VTRPDFGSRRSVRAGTPADAEAIRALLDGAGLARPSEPAAAGVRTAVCEFDGGLVGVLEWRDLGGELEILELAVAPEHRRRGHASFLLASFVGQTADAARQPVHLEVRASNAAAIRLYSRFGFAVNGTRRGYYRGPDEDALRMSRPAAG